MTFLPKREVALSPSPARLLVAVLIFCFIGATSQCVQAQLTGCPPQNSNTPGWQKGTSSFPTDITYDVSTLGQPEQGQIIAAFTAWNNSPSNCLHINFVRKDGSSSNLLVIPGSASGKPAVTTYTGRVPITNVLLSAIINIDVNNAGGTFFNRSNDAQFRGAVLKAALHEIGHSMGLGEEADNGNPATVGGKPQE